jgi:hypothetical protein
MTLAHLALLRQPPGEKSLFLPAGCGYRLTCGCENSVHSGLSEKYSAFIQQQCIDASSTFSERLFYLFSVITKRAHITFRISDAKLKEFACEF